MANIRCKRNDVYELVSENIKYYRKLRNMTQAELADKTQYSHEFIRRIESPNSKKYFSIDTVSHIADALEVDIKVLFNQRN